MDLFSIAGGSLEEATLCTLEPKYGLAAQLQVDPALVVVAGGRGHALSSQLLQHSHARAAQEAALQGCPAVALTLATSSPTVPTELAMDAAHAPLLALARGARGGEGGVGLRTPDNWPRAHFPFPERGRLGSPPPLQRKEQRRGAQLRDYAIADCWALNEGHDLLTPTPTATATAPATATPQDAQQQEREALHPRGRHRGGRIWLMKTHGQPGAWRRRPAGLR